MSKVLKKRYWAFVLYPESAPIDWQNQLQLTGLPCVISPIHDKDTNPDGTVKKAHYHVILAYSGPTTYNSVKRLTDDLKQPIPQAIDSVKGYYRYLTHMDNPEKAQYDENDIVALNGFNILDYVELTRREVNEYKAAIQLLIIERNIYEYSDLMDYLIDDPEMYDIACNNTLFFDRYITSRRQKHKEEGNCIVEK